MSRFSATYSNMTNIPPPDYNSKSSKINKIPPIPIHSCSTPQQTKSSKITKIKQNQVKSAPNSDLPQCITQDKHRPSNNKIPSSAKTTIATKQPTSSKVPATKAQKHTTIKQNQVKSKPNSDLTDTSPQTIKQPISSNITAIKPQKSSKTKSSPNKISTSRQRLLQQKIKRLTPQQ